MRRHELGPRLLRSGYLTLPRQRAAHEASGSDRDSFEARLLGRRALVVRGTEGARLFYDQSLLRRRDAVPPPLGWLLFGRGAVHTLDDEDHAARKALLRGILSPERVEGLVLDVERRLGERVATWGERGEVAVFDELVEVYGAAVLPWAGVELTADETRRRSHQLATIVDGFGGAGTAYVRAWRARVGANRWATTLVEDVRAGRLTAGPGTALGVLATGAGRDLSARVAGVELLNLVRPTVAVAWLGTFAALALDDFPEWRPRLVGPDGAVHRRGFAHEVRRVTPFAPALAARVRRGFEHDGHRLEEGDYVVLDIVGTHRDDRLWPAPRVFDPQRFAGGDPDPYALLQQGGGDPRTGHRCPGEPLTVRLLETTVGVLAGTAYDVATERRYDASRIPTLPPHGLRVTAS